MACLGRCVDKNDVCLLEATLWGRASGQLCWDPGAEGATHRMYDCQNVSLRGFDDVRKCPIKLMGLSMRREESPDIAKVKRDGG